jgi:hypothetical protein
MDEYEELCLLSINVVRELLASGSKTRTVSSADGRSIEGRMVDSGRSFHNDEGSGYETWGASEKFY